MAGQPAKRRTKSAPPRRRTANGGGERAPGRGKYDRSATPDQRHKDQERRLLEAAAHVFSEKGWADATVEDIVTRAGMSRRTFYEHFDDLRSCLLELHERATKAAVRAVESRVTGLDDPVQRLELGVTGFLGGIAAFPHIARVMFRVVREAGPEFEPLHERMMERFAKLVTDGVALAYAQGTISRPPDELRVFALCSAMEAVAMRFVARGEEDRALEAAPVLIDMVRKAFS